MELDEAFVVDNEAWADEFCVTDAAADAIDVATTAAAATAAAAAAAAWVFSVVVIFVVGGCSSLEELK